MSQPSMDVVSDLVHEAEVDLLVLPVCEAQSGPGTGEDALQDLDARLGGLLQAAREQELFTGKREQSLVQLPLGRIAAKRIAFVGLGRRDQLTEEVLRQAGAEIARLSMKAKHLGLALDHLAGPKDGFAEALLTGFGLASYRFTRMKSQAEEAPERAMTVLAAPGDHEGILAGLSSAAALASAVKTARDLGNLPGNELPPRQLALEAQRVAGEGGFRCEVLDEVQIQKLGMGALLAVARGSSEPPRFIELEYGAEFASAAGPVCLVGKGLTFDAGGISIKPAGDMDKMRYDMCGAAAVIGAMQAVAALELPIHVLGLIPASENLPDGQAMKPGDVIRAMNGTTIEVLNTDAEGRLILADALCYAQSKNPSLIIDLATLTGAVSIALGQHMAGLMGTAEAAIERLSRLGKATGERVWRLPLDEDYDRQIRGKWADLQNIGGREAGTITAAQFLKRFVGDTPWMHLDIAGVAWDDPRRAYAKGSGATGFGVRLLARFLEEMAHEG